MDTISVYFRVFRDGEWKSVSLLELTDVELTVALQTGQSLT